MCLFDKCVYHVTVPPLRPRALFLSQASMGIARALEDIRGAAAWLSRDGAAIGSYLDEWVAEA